MYVRPRPRFRPRNAGGVPFSPALLFTSGVAGAWYDPSDYSTLFQDSAGKTPVTAVEQPVGLMLDKSQGLVASTKSGNIQSAGAFFSTPDSIANSITGDIDIKVMAAQTNWAPINTQMFVNKTSNSGQYAYDLYSSGASASTLTFRISVNGTALSTAVSTNHGISNGSTSWIRVTRVASTGAVAFYKSSDGSNWTAIGTGSTTAGSIFNGTDTLCVGGQLSGNTFIGKIYRAMIFSGIDGTLAADFNPTLYIGGTTFTAATGEVWTINGNANITPDGNHASQATPTSCPVLRARYNLLTYSEQFDNAAWTVVGGNLLAFGSGSVANATAAPDGTTTADLIVPNTTPALHSIWQTAVTTVSGASYTASWYVKPNGYTKIAIVENQITGYYVAFDATGAGSVLAQSNATGTIAALANGWYRITHTSVAGASFRPQLFVLPPSYTSGSITAATWTPNGTDGVYIWGADLRTGSSAGTYQRIAAATDYATAGFLPYLYFVTDDSFGTNSIDFTATDKLSVCAGVTKLSDAATGTIASTNSSGLPGYFEFFAPSSTATNDFAFRSTGTLLSQANSASSYASPITAVLTGRGDISGDSLTLRFNGSQVASSTADQGTGNYGNYPLYIGRRNNASLPFEGRIYQLIVCGKTLSASELASTEAYVNSKTGAY